MLLEARNEFQLRLDQSVLVGDKPTDIMAAKYAGIKFHFKIKTNAKVDMDHLWDMVHS